MLSEILTVVAPELVARVFAAMAGLMWGAFAAARRDPSAVLWASCALLVAVGLWVGFQPEGTRFAFDGSFVVGRVRALLQGADPVRRRRDAGAQPRLPGAAGLMKFEFPVLILLSTVGHDDHGLGQRPDRALHGARAAVPRALRGRGLPARQLALDRGGAEVLRARLAVLGPAALRREPDLRLLRHHALRRDRRRWSATGRCRSG